MTQVQLQLLRQDCIDIAVKNLPQGAVANDVIAYANTLASWVVGS